MSYIGEKKIKNTKDCTGSEEVKLVEIEYENGEKEILSKLMYDIVVSEIACEATQLREKRITPVVASVLRVLRDWGIRLNELPYMSAVLNESLKQNENQAMLELWLPWNSTIKSIDDIDLIAVDRVLKTIKEKPVPSPYDAK